MSDTERNGWEEKLNFENLAPSQQVFPIGKKKYVITEASCDAATNFKNSQIEAARLTKEGNLASFGKVANSEPLLVSQCLYEAGDNDQLRLTVDGDPDPRYRVPERKIRSWPNKIQKNLFDWIIDHSDIRDDETEEIILRRIERDTKKLSAIRENRADLAAKNVQSATEGTFDIATN